MKNGKEVRQNGKIINRVTEYTYEIEGCGGRVFRSLKHARWFADRIVGGASQ